MYGLGSSLCVALSLWMTCAVIERDGTFTVLNSRTGYSKTYKRK